MRVRDLICRQSLVPPASLQLGVSQLARLFHRPTLPGPSQSYQRFVIVGQPRCGTGLLVSALNQHTGIRCYGEVFHPDHLYGKTQIGDPLAKLFRDLLPVAYLRTTVFRGYPEHIQAIGLKILAYQLGFCRNAALASHLCEREGVRVVHIYRENLLKQQLSEALAVRDQRWRAAGSPSKPEPIRLDPGACEKRFQRSLDDREFLLTSFADLPLLSLSYEDLVADMATELRRIQEHIGVPIQRLEPTTKKQRQWPVRELAKNWEELSEHFAGTGYAEWFRADS